MGHRTKTIDLKKWLKDEMGFVYDKSTASYVHAETDIHVSGEVVSNALALADPDEIRNMVADSVMQARKRALI
ncbi:MAG: hypothetical protein ACYTBY_10585 [Planctomycetota bacterium]|jgi:hypothetical protein